MYHVVSAIRIFFTPNSIVIPPGTFFPLFFNLIAFTKKNNQQNLTRIFKDEKKNSKQIT